MINWFLSMFVGGGGSGPVDVGCGLLFEAHIDDAPLFLEAPICDK